MQFEPPGPYSIHLPQGESTTTNTLHVDHVLDYLKRARFEPEVIASYQGRCVLVTGGAGAIGSNLCIALSELVGPTGKVVILDNLSATRAIYGSYPELPLREEFVSTHLTTPYQINKMTGEMYCNFYHHHYGMKIVNCRFFNSYGPGEVPGQYRNVIPNFIYWGMKKYSLPITGDGNETRDFTHALDLVQGLLKAGYYEAAVGREFNLAAGREIRIADMAALVNQTTGNPAPINFRPRRKWDTKPRLLASIERAQTLIDYQPITEFEEGFHQTIRWFEANWDRIEEGADFPPGMNSAVR